MRLAVEGGRVVGGATALPAGQWFGGRVVPAAARVRGVRRCRRPGGAGVAAALLRALAGAALEAGLLVAPLWASRTTLYRRWGWEIAGVAHGHTIALSALAGLRGAGRAGPRPRARDPGAAARRWPGGGTGRSTGPSGGGHGATGGTIRGPASASDGSRRAASPGSCPSSGPPTIAASTASSSASSGPARRAPRPDSRATSPRTPASPERWCCARPRSPTSRTWRCW